jgi:hypothetical protein
MMRALALLALFAAPAHAQVVSPPGVTLGQVQALMNQSLGPVTAKADSAIAKADTALADGLTSANRQQALRVQVTPDANGRAVFTYPMPYASGVKPAVTTTAETPNGAAYRNDASVEENSATNTQVVILVQRVPKSIVVSLLGSTTALISPVTTPVWINVLVRAPV